MAPADRRSVAKLVTAEKFTSENSKQVRGFRALLREKALLTLNQFCAERVAHHACSENCYFHRISIFETGEGKAVDMFDKKALFRNGVTRK
jgi:hypothetical protein